MWLWWRLQGPGSVKLSCLYVRLGPGKGSVQTVCQTLLSQKKKKPYSPWRYWNMAHDALRYRRLNEYIPAMNRLLCLPFPGTHYHWAFYPQQRKTLQPPRVLSRTLTASLTDVGVAITWYIHKHAKQKMVPALKISSWHKRTKKHETECYSPCWRNAKLRLEECLARLSTAGLWQSQDINISSGIPPQRITMPPFFHDGNHTPFALSARNCCLPSLSPIHRGSFLTAQLTAEGTADLDVCSSCLRNCQHWPVNPLSPL